MSVNISSNMGTSGGVPSLGISKAALQQRLARLSSTSQVLTSSDDAESLGVERTMNATINAASASLSNANSFLQTQGGALLKAGDVLSRMLQLKNQVDQSSPGDNNKIANYNDEFKSLQGQLTEITTGNFNGVALFVSGGGSLSVPTSVDGSMAQTITQSSLYDATSAVTTAGSGISGVTSEQITSALMAVESERAKNGAQANRLHVLSVNATNLTAAVNPIADMDEATKKTSQVKLNLMEKDSNSMLAQANSIAQTVMTLLKE